MKLLRKLDTFQKAEAGSLLPFPSTTTVDGIVSPWSDAELEKFVWSDILGLESVPMTRREAMSVPAISAARHRIVQLADRPLRALRGTEDTTQSHAWLHRTDTTETPWERIAHTLDDWIFYGWSLWLVARGADDFIQDARHVPYDRWGTSQDGSILVDQQPVVAGSYLLLNGPFDGLLTAAPETIRAAKSLERAWSSRVRNPTPTVILEEKDEGTVTKKEATAYVQATSKALRDPDGAVFFVPAKINLRLEAESGVDVLTEARNAVRIDIANYLNLNASALDGAKPQSSLTYETQQTEQAELMDRMAFWTAPLEHRLSMDDVVPRGTRVRFDFATTTPAQTGTPTED